MGPDAQARTILSPRQSDQARWSRPTRAKAWLEPCKQVRTPVSRTGHVPGPGPGWLVHSLTIRLSMGHDAQARSIPSPQPSSVGFGVLSPPASDSARAGVVPGWAGPNVSGPSAARAGTGTRLAVAVAHEWLSVPTVVGAGSSSLHHPQSSVPISLTRRAGPARLGPWPAICRFWRLLSDAGPELMQRSDWQRKPVWEFISQRALQKRRNSRNRFRNNSSVLKPQRSDETKLELHCWFVVASIFLSLPW